MIETAPTNDMRLLAPLREACLRAVANRQLEPGDVPLAGMCVEVSLIVRGVFGGILLSGFVGKEQHYWNRLPDGRELDITSDQFGGDGYAPLIKGTPVDVPSPIPLTAILFAQHVLANLNA